MRQAYNDSALLEQGNVFYGVALGYDCCAEHEWGIAGLDRKFGIESKNSMKDGIDRRTISKGEISIRDIENFIVISSNEKWYYNLRTFVDELNTFWDSYDFSIVLRKTPKNVLYVEQLKQAFENKDIVICSGLGLLGNNSLSIIIKSRLPQDCTDRYNFIGKKAAHLLQYEESIGVTLLKEKAKGKGYKENHYFLACSPNWINYEDEKKREIRKKELGTNYDITFWVNYSDSDDNYGWYTAEEIIKWLSTDGLRLVNIRGGRR